VLAWLRARARVCVVLCMCDGGRERSKRLKEKSRKKKSNNLHFYFSFRFCQVSSPSITCPMFLSLSFCPRLESLLRTVLFCTLVVLLRGLLYSSLSLLLYLLALPLFSFFPITSLLVFPLPFDTISMHRSFSNAVTKNTQSRSECRHTEGTTSRCLRENQCTSTQARASAVGPQAH